MNSCVRTVKLPARNGHFLMTLNFSKAVFPFLLLPTSPHH
ncbi:Uncharacterised protein [Vibrio cholerae]|uniref:Uncharacterized protein n=1 Tax=Vibrio cholerae TaxID=666 RepID=A0A655TBY3_VIBCL|nr:Uncharacterised protein [Vibrio cholerae]CRZ88081.1 Uncharacterised protein [Vibrio cholerae]CSA07536.1 Uncharacterised protein [Vibrio cholerae]CSA78503.1 Uncharacterised protein [Vibrio cholerae]CSB09081.1 Uncharacterised protein [Vibrio cholerae]